MEAKTLKVSHLINGAEIFEVPYYQRNYVWKEEQWRRFLEDMENITLLKNDYFLGSVILKQQNTPTGSIARRTIIDGQQRFTTIAIFCKSLCLKKNNMDAFTHRFRIEGRPDLFLLHSLNDREDFERIMNLDEDAPIADEKPSRIIAAYNYFQENIDVSKLDYFELISHLLLIVIDLQQNDDEQTIFDTINSLGVRLTTGELLKNYFFNANTREEYEELWLPIFEKDKEISNYWDAEVSWGRTKRSNIDAFFSAFLAIKIQDPNINVSSEHKERFSRAERLFANYKELMTWYELDKKAFIYEVVNYAEFYRKNIKYDIAQKKIPGTPCIDRINFIIYTLDCTTIVPYVLYVLMNVPNEQERNAIFGYLETYLIRRVICKTNNNNYSDLFGQMLIGNQIKTFDNLKNYIENRGEDKALYLPSDKNVKECLKTVEHPNKRAAALLYLIESRLRDGKPHATALLPFEDYTLEHLMPKKWEKNWPLIGGYDEDDRNRVVSTLGNMALIPAKLNSAISNASWSVKKIGKNSNVGLSVYASDLETLKDVILHKDWNENTIILRAEKFAETIEEFWPSYLPKDDTEENTPGDLAMGTKGARVKYSIEESNFVSMSEFVLMVVKLYMEKYPNISYHDLKKIFHDGLCADGFKCLGFLCTELEYNKWNSALKEKRYCPNRDGRRLVSSDGVVFFVNTQWVRNAMPPIVRLAQREGWKVVSNQ